MPTTDAAERANASYLGYYPIGAFLVDSRQALGPLVSHLRNSGRLKSGTNVTPFDACAVESVTLLPTNNSDARGEQELQQLSLVVNEAYGEEAGQGANMRIRHLVTVSAGSVPFPTGHASQTAPELVRRLGETNDQSAPSPFFAVHATGAWSEAELAALLAPSCEGRHSATALAYVDQLRVFSRACLPSGPAGDKTRATPAAMPFLALKHLALRGERPAPSVNATYQETAGEKPREQKEATSFTFSELFGGIGMFRLGLERAGGVACFGVEFATPARIVYEANFSSCAPSPRVGKAEGVHQGVAPLASDITDIPSVCFPAHDVMTAGFPCQSFAKAGPANGLHGSKGWLFYEVIRVLLASRPRVFLLENVANLVEVEEGAQLAEILRCLRAPSESPVAYRNAPGCVGSGFTNESVGLRYEVDYRVIDGGMVTPQTRKRVYFIGRRIDGEGEGIAGKAGERVATPSSRASVLSHVFDDATERLLALGRKLPYHSVRDLLEPQPLPGAGAPEEVGGITKGSSLYVSDDDICSRADAGHTSTVGSTPHSCVLTDIQFEAVRRSHTYRQNPAWRLVHVQGNARTLLGSYRTSFQLYSEFVPFPDTRLDMTVEQLATMLREEYPELPGREEQSGTQTTTVKAKSTVPPPLRFFTVRECARLQGIPDTFYFPMMRPTADEDGSGMTSPRPRRHYRAGGGGGSTPLLPPGAVYKLIGNAVNPLVIECLAGSVVDHLLVTNAPSLGHREAMN